MVHLVMHSRCQAATCKIGIYCYGRDPDPVVEEIGNADLSTSLNRWIKNDRGAVKQV